MDIKDVYIAITYDTKEEKLKYSIFYQKDNEYMLYVCRCDNAHIAQNYMDFEHLLDKDTDYVKTATAKEKAATYSDLIKLLFIGNKKESKDFSSIHLLSQKEGITYDSDRDANLLILFNLTNEIAKEFSAKDFFIGSLNTQSRKRKEKPDEELVDVSIPIFIVKYASLSLIDLPCKESILIDYLRQNQNIIYSGSKLPFLTNFFDNESSNDVKNDKDYKWQPYSTACNKLYTHGSVRKVYNNLMQDRMANIWLSIFISILTGLIVALITGIDLSPCKREVSILCLVPLLLSIVLVFYYAFKAHIVSVLNKVYHTHKTIVEKNNSTFEAFFKMLFKKNKIEDVLYDPDEQSKNDKLGVKLINRVVKRCSFICFLDIMCKCAVFIVSVIMITAFILIF